MDKEYYSVGDFAKKMRVGRTTVYRWIRLGVIRAIQKVEGGDYRIPSSELEKMYNG